MFLESFTQASLAAISGKDFSLQQVNMSVSIQGTLRGIHFADVPPGQAKYVQCLSGEIVDLIVDLRVGSPAFCKWQLVHLDSQARQSLLISEGVGHGFCALSSEAVVGYLCSSPYTPEREHTVNPFDSDLGISWPLTDQALLSDRDRTAPPVRELLDAGLLPTWTDYLALNTRGPQDK